MWNLCQPENDSEKKERTASFACFGPAVVGT